MRVKKGVAEMQGVDEAVEDADEVDVIVDEADEDAARFREALDETELAALAEAETESRALEDAEPSALGDREVRAVPEAVEDAEVVLLADGSAVSEGMCEGDEVALFECECVTEVDKLVVALPSARDGDGDTDIEFVEESHALPVAWALDDASVVCVADDEGVDVEVEQSELLPDGEMVKVWPLVGELEHDVEGDEDAEAEAETHRDAEGEKDCDTDTVRDPLPDRDLAPLAVADEQDVGLASPTRDTTEEEEPLTAGENDMSPDSVGAGDALCDSEEAADAEGESDAECVEDGHAESEAVSDAVDEGVLERGGDTEVDCVKVALGERLALGVTDTVALGVRERGADSEELTERDAIAVAEGETLLLFPGLSERSVVDEDDAEDVGDAGGVAEDTGDDEGLVESVVEPVDVTLEEKEPDVVADDERVGSSGEPVMLGVDESDDVGDDDRVQSFPEAVTEADTEVQPVDHCVCDSVALSDAEALTEPLTSGDRDTRGVRVKLDREDPLAEVRAVREVDDVALAVREEDAEPLSVDEGDRDVCDVGDALNVADNEPVADADSVFVGDAPADAVIEELSQPVPDFEACCDAAVDTDCVCVD